MNEREKIADRVAKLGQAVRDERGDNENWHGEEDEIQADALQAIANGAADPRGIAREALKVYDESVVPSYAKWYA